MREPRMTPVGSGDPADATTTSVRRDPAMTWARPVERLTIGSVPDGAINLNVAGRRLAGPLQGFGQLWQKTYRIRFEGATPAPHEVIEVWKREFGSFWPPEARFFAPFAGIAPGEVGLINADVPGGSILSTGVMVIYVDDESFTFMTPEGHVFGAWITFSAERDEDGATGARIVALLRAGDPLYELGLLAGGHGKENRHWERTLLNLAARFDATGNPTTEQVCIDRRRQWRQATNLRHNAAVRSGLWVMAHPWRMVRRARR